MFYIGNYLIRRKALLAPMAGITDKPFREICRSMGAGLTTSEMVASAPQLRKTDKTQKRLEFAENESPRSIQIVGADPRKLADAAMFAADSGAQIIDINMGCPAKKVCNVYAGSALLKEEKLVANILESVVNSVSVPVTLKIRTGWSADNKNGITIAKLAESAGISAIAVHGRTRECAYKGNAEYDTVAEIKSRVNIPVVVNGDINSVGKAAKVLAYTNADAVMIGRAAQGNPWIFRELNTYFDSGLKLPRPSLDERLKVLTTHLKQLYDFYGEYKGLRIARKHLNWYCSEIEGYSSFRKTINQLENANDQLAAVKKFFHQSTNEGEQAA